MARFRCRSCGQDGTFEYDGRHACPKCGSRNVQLAMRAEELTDDDPLVEAMKRLADDGGDETED